jgi:hypothetical protein
MLRVGLIQHTTQRHLFECGPRLYRFADDALALVLAKKEKREQQRRPRSTSFDPSLTGATAAGATMQVCSEPGTPQLGSPRQSNSRAGVHGRGGAASVLDCCDSDDDEDDTVLENILGGLMRDDAAAAAAAVKAQQQHNSSNSSGSDAPAEGSATAPASPFTNSSSSSNTNSSSSSRLPHSLDAALRRSIEQHGIVQAVAYPPVSGGAVAGEGNWDWQYIAALQTLLLLFPAPPTHEPAVSPSAKRRSMAGGRPDALKTVVEAASVLASDSADFTL